MKKLLILLFFPISFWACDAINIGAMKKVRFKPTQCANPWDNVGYTGDATDRFRAYLKENGIDTIEDFTVSTDQKSYCEACTCKGPDTYIFRIPKEDYELLKTIPPFDQTKN